MPLRTLCLLLVALLPQHATALDNGLARRPQMGWNSWYDLMCTSQMNEATIKATADKLVTTGLANVGFRYVNLDDCYIKSRLPNGTLMPDPKTFPSGMRSLADYLHNISSCQNATCADTSCPDCTCKTAPRNISLCNYSAPAQMKFGVYTDRGESGILAFPTHTRTSPRGTRAIVSFKSDVSNREGCRCIIGNAGAGPKTCAGRPAAEGHESIDANTYANWQIDYLKEDSCAATRDPPAAEAQYAKMRDGESAR
jgi:hypothetical protein